jgi:signal transduction histidine kinase
LCSADRMLRIRIMKITTRIISGYGLFIAILSGLVIYQVITINSMQSINRTLKDINFHNTMISLNAIENLKGVEDFTKKFSIDPESYRLPLVNFQREYETNLRELRRNALSIEEQNSVKRLAESWQSFITNLKLLQNSSNRKEAVANLEEELKRLEVLTQAVHDSTVNSMKEKVSNSEATGETAALVLYSVTVFALAISILVSFLIYRSISKPLANLTEGTRAIAEGKFFYRLDTSRNDEFSQLAKDFNTMTHRLNDLDELKKDFVSHVSHELKAPLASMQETIQLMLEEIPGPLTDKQKRLLQLNLQSGLRLTSMISNLLDLSKIEAGVMEYELKSRDLLPLAKNAIAELDGQAQERKIRIEAAFPNAPLLVECDSDRIVQVLVNLVGNAVNFSSKGGIVHVKVEAAEEIPGNVPESWRRLITHAEDGKPFGLVTITDTGPGIPDSDKEKVFEKFHQIKRGKKVVGQGVGLGLAICRTIVQAHRGAIWAENNPGGGSRFSLLLRPGQEGDKVIPRASVPI